LLGDPLGYLRLCSLSVRLSGYQIEELRQLDDLTVSSLDQIWVFLEA
jgi:hypothetical protein